MKIFYAAFKYEYGNVERGFSFEHYNFYDTLVKMNERENNVIYFPVDQMLKQYGRDKMNSRLLEVVFKEKPDLCFFFLVGEEIKKETIKDITEKSKVLTLNWFADDHWKFGTFSRHWAPCFSWVVTTDSLAVKKYQKTGYKNVIHSQWACNHFLCKPLNLPKIYDVTFLGQPHGNRKKIVEKIKKSGINIECWGWGWSQGCVSEDKMVEIFSQSKINLGLTNSSFEGPLKSLFRIFFKKSADKKIKIDNPFHWLGNLKMILNKQKNQLKGRNYDVPGCGSFLLTQDADDLKNRYQDGKEIVIFKDNEDLIKKINYFLKNDKERESIAKAGYERTIKEHTYEKRFNEIFNIMGLNKNG
jgi:spore maturation protein CgeB